MFSTTKQSYPIRVMSIGVFKGWIKMVIVINCATTMYAAETTPFSNYSLNRIWNIPIKAVLILNRIITAEIIGPLFKCLSGLRLKRKHGAFTPAYTRFL